MFKESFKYYKSKEHPPSMKDVVDFEKISNCSSNIRQLTSAQAVSSNVPPTKFGLKEPKTWEIFELTNTPGLIFIKNPLTALGQRYWTIRCTRDYPFPPNKTNLKNELFEISNIGKSKLSLRWATLGYHHNWDSKIYSEDFKNDFPNDLAELTRIVAQVLGFSDFKPQAAIVNYYYFDSTLSGHTDHSEENLDAPLFSFSLGQSAIFLIGGRTLDEKPTPILIRSGDIVAMTKNSRLCYHGVPKILKDEIYSKWRDIDLGEELKDENNVIESCFNLNSWLPYEQFLNNARINMNVRQVLKVSQHCLSR